ncbi:hypothetical protein Tco_1478082 [Tanacetum coccineum]
MGSNDMTQRCAESTPEALPPPIVLSNSIHVTTTVKNSDSMKKLTMANMENKRACFNEPATTTIKDLDSTKKLAMAKLENKRACFNDPVTTTINYSDSTNKITIVDSIQEATLDKQQRPSRKRKWSES